MENQINLFTVQDIWDEQDKQIPIDCRKKYDPLHFWEDFGEKYLNLFNAKDPKIKFDIQRNLGWILHKVRGLEIKTLLDVGCGFCRLEPFLLDGNAIEEATCIDISAKQIACVDVYLKDYPKRDKIKIVQASVKNLPFESNSFDCVLSSECFQHLHLPSVRAAFANIAKVSKKYLVVVERFVFEGEHPQPYLWSHNYIKLATDFGFKVLESKLIANGVMGIILEK